MNRDLEFPDDDPQPTISLPVYANPPKWHRQRVYTTPSALTRDRVWMASCTCGWTASTYAFATTEASTRYHVWFAHRGEWS